MHVSITDKRINLNVKLYESCLHLRCELAHVILSYRINLKQTQSYPEIYLTSSRIVIYLYEFLCGSIIVIIFFFLRLSCYLCFIKHKHIQIRKKQIGVPIKIRHYL